MAKPLEWTTEQRKPNDLLPLDINPRKITEAKRKKLIESLEKFNLAEIPAINRDNTVIAGNQRLKAMQLMGRGDELIDVRVPNRKLTQKELKEYALIANTHAGEWDMDIFEEFFQDVNLDDMGLSMDDFKTPDFGDLTEQEPEPEIPEAEEDDFEVPEENQIKTDIVEGDLIEIGEHRLLCGDSTDSDAVAKLMDGEKADMVFTDPPYGVRYQSNSRKKSPKFDVLKNDDGFLTEWISNIALFSTGFVFVWTSWKVVTKWIEFLNPIGQLTNMIIWDKGGGGLGDLDGTFASDFEIALCYNRNSKIIGKRLGSVWNVNRDRTDTYLHPTQKPILLAATAIENIISIKKIVLDFFLGSGSTMVAAHQLKRRCYGMELDPKYCQVIIDRMLKLDPTLEIKRNGELYEGRN